MCRSQLRLYETRLDKYYDSNEYIEYIFVLTYTVILRYKGIHRSTTYKTPRKVQSTLIYRVVEIHLSIVRALIDSLRTSKIRAKISCLIYTPWMCNQYKFNFGGWLDFLPTNSSYIRHQIYIDDNIYIYALDNWFIQTIVIVMTVWPIVIQWGHDNSYSWLVSHVIISLSI